MSKEKKELTKVDKIAIGRHGRSKLKCAKEYAEEAASNFKENGDKEMEKESREVADKADKAYKKISSKLNDNK
jgi:hypothetical protein